jgi:hypothetical protein
VLDIGGDDSDDRPTVPEEVSPALLVTCLADFISFVNFA